MKHFSLHNLHFNLFSDFSWNDFIAGWVGGVAGLLVGHPADTIKVRQQTYGTTLWPSVSRTYKHEGVRGFFKGMLFPLLTTGPVNSIFFGFYGNSLRYLEEGPYLKSQAEDPQYLQKVFIAGCTGGFATVFFTCPIELVKVVLQAHTDGKGWGQGNKVAAKRGMVECIRHIYKEGGFLGFYRGFVPMLWRDVPSYGVYTWVYEACLHYVFRPEVMGDVSRQIFAGGLAGIIAWGMCMPFDLIKSRMQADFNNTIYKGMIDCTYKSYKSEGYQIFCKGMLVTCLRAFPVNAATFVLYERTIVLCCTSWIVCMPFDLVKTKMQADNIQKPKYRGMIHCLMQSFHEGGLLSFNRGMTATLLRAFPSHAVIFIIYEYLLKRLAGDGI